MPATLDGTAFRIDPTVVSWDFKPKVSSTKTVGGKVVQVYGVELGDLVIEGSFGRGGWEEQAAFLDRMKAAGDNQMEQFGREYPQPYRFFWPEKSWDMLVWLKAFSDGSGMIQLSNEIVAPKWRLTFHIVEDNSGLKKLATDEFIERLAAGIGWRQSEFNGPIDWANALSTWQTVGASNVRDFLNIAFGRGAQTPTGNQDVTGSESVPVTAGAASFDQVAAYAYQAGFRGEALVTAIAVSFAESGGRVDALGTNTNGSRDRGLWQINTIHGYTDQEMFNPVKNANVAFSISHGGTDWSPWYAWRDGKHEQFIPQARAAAAKMGA